MSNNRKPRHRITFMLPGSDKPSSIYVPYRDGKKWIKLARTLADAINGVPGAGIECMNAQCALRLRGDFPHDVHLVEFKDSRAYVVDKLDKNGMPARCVRYAHNEGKEQREFDVPGGKEKMISQGLVEKRFFLNPPPKRSRKSATHEGIQHPTPTTTRPTKTGSISYARMVRAGKVDAMTLKAPTKPDNLGTQHHPNILPLK